MIERVILAMVVSLQAVALVQGALELRVNDIKCNSLGSGGDVRTVGLAGCRSCDTESCLHVIHNTKTTWHAANEYCQNLVGLGKDIENSHLAVILTQDKLDAVKSFMNNLTDSMKPRAVWIGLKSTTSSCSFWEKFKCGIGAYCGCKTWMWLDTVPMHGTPHYWSSGQPGGAWSINGGDCVKMARDHDWRYFDDPCSTSLNFLRQPNGVLCEASLKTTA